MTTKDPRTILDDVRDMAPRQALTLSEAYELSEQQAARLLQLLDISAPHVSFDKLFDLPNITVKGEPKYRMQHAGLSRYRKGKWLILVDKNDVHGRRRFTFAHELKHVIDDPMEQELYADLGYGDPQERHRHVEAICQYFAACLLMPRPWVTAAWLNGIRDLHNLASLFQVSTTAMHVRLKYLGLWDDQPERDVRSYFRPTHSGRLRPKQKRLHHRADRATSKT